MKVLVIGGGGREHALAWKLSQSKKVEEIFVAPGNAGTELIATNVAIESTQIEKLVEFALASSIDLTIVGMDNSLALGVVDAFESKGLKIFGPSKYAAQIESSKSFSKQMMKRLNIPTAEFKIFDDYDESLAYCQSHLPIVIKADGLALGKGVYACKTVQDCKAGLTELLVECRHGEAGSTVIIEEFLEGYEISLHAVCDGKNYSLFPVAQDHKPIFDGDRGPNTGGMGVIAPVNTLSEVELQSIADAVIRPILDEFRRLEHPFVGCLYPGLFITSKGFKVLEYNARFGDPECQVYMRLLDSDLVEIIQSCLDGSLASQTLKWSDQYAACVVLASGGYPESSEKGVVISGFENVVADKSVQIFQAGTKRDGNKVVTNGGRVLNVTATGKSLETALNDVYRAVDKISFKNMQYRKDIGNRKSS